MFKDVKKKKKPEEDSSLICHLISTSALAILISVFVSFPGSVRLSSFMKICKTKDCHSVTVQHDLGGTRLGEVLKIVVLCRWVMNSSVSQKYYHTTDMYRSLAHWYYSLNICIYQWSMEVNYFICYAIFFFSYYGRGGVGRVCGTHFVLSFGWNLNQVSHNQKIEMPRIRCCKR